MCIDSFKIPTFLYFPKLFHWCIKAWAELSLSELPSSFIFFLHFSAALWAKPSELLRQSFGTWLRWGCWNILTDSTLSSPFRQQLFGAWHPRLNPTHCSSWKLSQNIIYWFLFLDTTFSETKKVTYCGEYSTVSQQWTWHKSLAHHYLLHKW